MTGSFLLRAAVVMAATAPLTCAGIVSAEPSAPSIADETAPTRAARASVTLNGRTLRYTIEEGLLDLRGDDGAPYHRMSYTAYTVAGERRLQRPLTFVWNGGPGGSAIWLQMGAFGPRRLSGAADEAMTTPPYRLIDNPQTLLDQTDLVFVDAPGSGYGHPLGRATMRDVLGLDKDARAFARFVMAFVDAKSRWASPKFLIGESYGTTRAAIVTGLLQEAGVEVNGVVLVSPLLDVGNIGVNFSSTMPGPDFWYASTLPSFAMIGQTLGLAGKDVAPETWAARAKAFSIGPYAHALALGDQLDESAKRTIAKTISQLTGLSTDYVAGANLRVSTFAFRKALLRDQHVVLGRFNGAVSGYEPKTTGDDPSYDPSAAMRNGAYLGSFLAMLDALNLKMPATYHSSAPDVLDDFVWEHRPRFSGAGGLPTQRSYDVGPDLGMTALQNPKLRIFFASGYTDLASPFGMAEHDASHLGLGRRYDSVLTYRHYEGGHTFYENEIELAKFREDLRAFYSRTLAADPKATSFGKSQSLP